LNKKFVIAYLVFILVIAIIPINGKESTVNNTFVFSLRLDYIFHIILFSPWWLFKPKSYNKIRSWFVFGLLFAIFSELIQYFVPYRAFNINDLIANCSGVIFGTFIFVLLKVFNNTKKVTN